MTAIAWAILFCAVVQYRDVQMTEELKHVCGFCLFVIAVLTVRDFFR